MRIRRISPTLMFLIPGLLLLTVGAAAQDDDDELTGLLEEVGGDYASAYLAPLVSGFGASQNGALYSTAFIPRTGLTFSVGLKVMGTRINEDDQTFSKVTTVTLDERFDVFPGDPGYGEPGVLEAAGPTVFGDDEQMGRITAYYEGIPVYTAEGIEGLVDLRTVPLVAPEFSVGGVMGMRAVFRWFPEMDLGDIGKLTLFGFGLQYSVNAVAPTLPVDVMVGFFRQDLDVGDSVQTQATSFYAAASRPYGLATVYAGVSLEDSEIDVSYTTTGGDAISFTDEGVQDARFTMGATLDLGADLNVELGLGKMTTLGAGLLVAF